MRLIDNHILRKVHEQVVLVPLSDHDTAFQGMIVLNHTGEWICRRLQEDTDRDSLIAGLAETYGMPSAQVAADVDAFLADLDSCQMLIR